MPVKIKNTLDTQSKKLLKELQKNKVKFTKRNVIFARKNIQGEILFLEEGNTQAGLKHIVKEHSVEFKKLGVKKENIANFIQEILSKSPQYIGGNSRGKFADYVLRGKKYRVVYGNNGFIVTCYPVS